MDRCPQWGQGKMPPFGVQGRDAPSGSPGRDAFQWGSKERCPQGVQGYSPLELKDDTNTSLRYANYQFLHNFSCSFNTFSYKIHFTFHRRGSHDPQSIYQHFGLPVHISTLWLGDVVVKKLDLRFLVASSIPSHDTAWLFLSQVTVFRGLTILGYNHHPGQLSRGR